MTDLVFEIGDKVRATCSYAHQIVEGKTYTVVKYEPPSRHDTFTWPAYVTVIGDHGSPVTGHTHRFSKV